MTAAAIARLFERWTAEPEQSTRPVALIRIALAAVVLSRFAAELTLFKTLEPSGVFFCLLFFALATMMLVGYMARAATACMAGAIAVIYFTGSFGNEVAQWNHHHVYLLMSATALLACTPCDRSYSVDRYRAIRLAERQGEAPPAERGRLWGQRLIVLQLGALYFWTAFDKTDWAFLSGQRLEQILTWTYSGRALERVLDGPLALSAISIAVVAVEYGLAIGVFVRPWHRFVIPAGLALHGSFYLLLPVETYSITMMVLYLALPDPDSVHRFLDRLQGHATAAHPL